MNQVSQPHHSHGFFQSAFLLIDNRLDDHGRRVDPRQGHEQGKSARNGQNESVVHAAWVRKLLQAHSRKIF